MIDKGPFYGLGVYKFDDKIHLFYNNPKRKKNPLVLDSSRDGFKFGKNAKSIKLYDAFYKPVDTLRTRDFRFFRIRGKHMMTFRLLSRNKYINYTAEAKNLTYWKVVNSLNWVRDNGHRVPFTFPCAVVPNYKLDNRFVMFLGDKDLKVAFSEDLINWKISKKSVLSPRKDLFDNGDLIPARVEMTEKGISVFYYSETTIHGHKSYSLGNVLLDKRDPHNVLFRSSDPSVEHVEGFRNKIVRPMGIADRDKMMFSYWDVKGEGVIAIAHPMGRRARTLSGKTVRLVLEKFRDNPILKPIASHFWESKAVFNPAALYDKGKVHLIYRAIGDDDVSSLGYAASSDGETIDHRHDKPMYYPREDFEISKSGRKVYWTPSPYASGGGVYGGCEDPRITRIEDKYYLMYVAHNGANLPRVAMTSINRNDFLNGSFDKWAKSVLISRPGVVDKNACVLSEKVNGKYVVFHRIFPNILVDYVDSMDNFDGESVWLEGEHAIEPSKDGWDTRKVGIGAPPIKTDHGWLLIYQGVGDNDPARYKIGAMLLDNKRPEKVLFRTQEPILEPDRWYENEGMKYGIVYPCGAVTMKDDLHVYYGGADMVSCHAKAHLPTFIEKMTHHETPHLHSVMQTVV